MPLKSQDIVVLLKLCGYAEGARPSYANIAKEFRMSPSEVYSVVKRLKNSRLIHGSELKEKPNLTAFEELLIHGIKYTFPAEHGKLTRGIRSMPTTALPADKCGQ